MTTINPYAAANTIQTAGYSPYTNNPVISDDNTSGTTSGLSADFTSISSMVANAGGGGFAAYKFGAQMSDGMKNIFSKNFMGGLKTTAITGFKGAGISALVSAGVSAAANGIGVATGKVDSSEAVSNVIKDTIGGAVGGLTGVAAGGLGYMLLGRFGTIGTIASVALGAVGGVAGGQLANKMTSGF